MGEESTLYEKLDNQVQKDVIPRLEAVEKQQQEYNLQLSSLKNDLHGVTLSQQDVKNTVTQYGQDHKNTLDKLLNHILSKDKIVANTESQVAIVKTQNEGQFKIAQLGFKEKVIATLFGAGGLYGIFTAVKDLF